MPVPAEKCPFRGGEAVFRIPADRTGRCKRPAPVSEIIDIHVFLTVRICPVLQNPLNIVKCCDILHGEIFRYLPAVTVHSLQSVMIRQHPGSQLVRIGLRIYISAGIAQGDYFRLLRRRSNGLQKSPLLTLFPAGKGGGVDIGNPQKHGARGHCRQNARSGKLSRPEIPVPDRLQQTAGQVSQKNRHRQEQEEIPPCRGADRAGPGNQFPDQPPQGISSQVHNQKDGKKDRCS